MDRTAALEMVIRAKQELRGIDATIRRIKEMKSQMASLARRVAGYVTKIVSSVKKMKDAFIRLNNTMRTLRNMALKAFTAIVSLTGIPLKFFADFQQGMSNVNTLLNVSRKELDGYSNEVVRVSNNVGESAKSLSGALYDIISAGVANDKSIAVLEKSAKAAKAGMTDTKTAANAGLAAINAYGLEIKNLGQVYDLQFSTVKKGVITFAQLASAQGQLLPSSRKLNVNLKEMYGSLAFLTKVGLNAEEASTALARAFDALSQEKDKFKALGVSVFDASGEFRGMVEVVADLSSALEGLSSEEQVERLESLGMDIRAARAIVPMIKNLEDYKTVIGDVSDSAGSMNEAYKKAIDNITFHWDRAKQNVINAFMNIGAAFEDEVRDMLDQITAWARAIGDFIVENKEAIKSILKFAIKLAGVVLVVAAIASALTFLLTTMGALVAGIAVLAAVWYLNIGGIREKTEDAWETVTDVVNIVWTVMSDFWNWLIGTDFEQKLEDIKKIVEQGWEIVIDIAGEGWDFIKQYLPEGVAKKIEEAAKIIIKAAIEWTGETYEAIKKGLNTGDWSDAFKKGLELTETAITIWASLKLLQLTGFSVLKAIGSFFGNAAGFPIAGGAIGLLSVGIQLKEAIDGGKGFVEFGANLITALAIGLGIFAFTGSPQAGVLAFTLAINLKLGETVKNILVDPLIEGLEEISNYDPSGLDPMSHVYDYALMQYGNGYYSTGGMVFGAGTSTSDSIPAWLSNGEFVVNAEATKKWRPLLEKINSGDMPGFAKGGAVAIQAMRGYRDGKFVEQNKSVLVEFGLQDDMALQKLAEIAEDTKNFRYVVELIAGFHAMKKEMTAQYEALKEQYKELVASLDEAIKEDDGSSVPADPKDSWKPFVSSLGKILENELDELADTMGAGWKEFTLGIQSALANFNSHPEGLGGAIGEVIDMFKGGFEGGITEAFKNLSASTVNGIASIFDSIKSAIISAAEKQAELKVEEFNKAMDDFREAVDRFSVSVGDGGNLTQARQNYSEIVQKTKETARKYEEAQEAKRQADAAKKGAGWGGILGGIAGFLIAGPIGAVIGAAAGGAGGALIGKELGGGKDLKEQLEKQRDLLEKAKEELAATIEKTFGLNIENFISNLNKDMIDAINSGEDLGKAVGLSVFGQVKASLQKVFVWAANDLIAQYLEPILTDAKKKIMDAIIEGNSLDVNTLMDIDELIKVAKQAEKVAEATKEMTRQYKEALREAGVDEEIIKQLFPEDISEEAQKLASALKDAMSEALSEGDLSTFSAGLGEAIYSNAKDGLTKAFMEAEVYQEMFKKWFEASDISFTGDLETDFANMQSLLEKLKRELREAGMDFDYTEIPTVGNGASLDEGLYGSESYFAPSTLEAGRDMAEKFATAIDQFVVSTESLVTSLNKLTDELKHKKVINSGKDHMSPIKLIRPIPSRMEKKYIITINPGAEDDLAKRLVKEIKLLEDNEE